MTSVSGYNRDGSFTTAQTFGLRGDGAVFSHLTIGGGAWVDRSMAARFPEARCDSAGCRVHGEPVEFFRNNASSSGLYSPSLVCMRYCATGNFVCRDEGGPYAEVPITTRPTDVFRPYNYKPFHTRAYR